MEDNTCCPVRAYLVTAIVATKGKTAPVELADFISDWGPPIIVQARFCPYCGAQIRHDEKRITTYFPHQPEDPQ